MPTPNESSSLPRVVILPGRRDVGGVSATLREAVLGDLVDILGEFHVKREPVSSGTALGKLLGGQGATLVLFDDLLSPGPSMIDGMLEALSEFDIVIGPAFQGGIYGVAARELPLKAAERAAVFLSAGGGQIPDWTGLIVEEVLQGFWQAPWYRGWEPGTLRFAREHLRALERSDDPECVALRTLNALEKME